MSGLNIEGAQIDDLEKYNNMCVLIKKLIKKVYPNLKIRFDQINNMDLVYIIIENNVKIALMPNTEWINLKKEIDDKLNYKTNENCELCKEKITKLACCNSCKKYTCIECYIKNFIKNSGIIKCHYCSYSFGVYTPPEYIDILVDDIRENAKIK